MEISLNTIQPHKNSRKKTKRLGRGDASGRGSYSTKGIKGQKARAGSSGFRRRGLKQLLTKLPKFKGQKPIRPSLSVVNLFDLEKHFQDNDVVNTNKLIQKNIIKTSQYGVKVLSGGKLTKKIIVFSDAFSAPAKEAIEKLGGKAIIIKKK